MATMAAMAAMPVVGCDTNGSVHSYIYINKNRELYDKNCVLQVVRRQGGSGAVLIVLIVSFPTE